MVQYYTVQGFKKQETPTNILTRVNHVFKSPEEAKLSWLRFQQ